MNLDQHPADRIAPATWEQRDMRRALAARDLKTVYERLQRVGVSQRQIARLTGQSASEIYEVLRGRRVMAHDLLIRIADGLGVPRGYMGLAYDESTEAALDLATATFSSRESERDQVRALLSHAANITMGTSVSEVARWWQPVDREVAPAPSRIGLCDVEHVRALTAAMRALDYRHGGGACRDAVAAQVRWVQQLLEATCSQETRTRLLLALADLHNLAGWTSFDVGMYSTARRHFARALEQAKAVNDLSLAANILYRMGRLHLHRGMHRDALRFFQLGQITAQDSGCGLTVSMLCANEAWAYALVGDRKQMDRSIGRAKDEFIRADHGTAQAWVRFFGEADLYASIGVAMASLTDANDADVSDAIRFLNQALDHRGADMTRSRIFEATALAVAHLRGGDDKAGKRAARDAVASAATVRSIRTLDRLQPLQEIATRYPADSDIQAIANDIKTLRIAT
ncbi:helix-turn-helix transcriptional regulator [Solwaraspora sp. WMMD406]|uniref:helix-turn-helix domain-containing protein n=1 Tax=Solwaraspora sp. WMMD406 TaxID=3016095 RepID=UPI0024163002|nr:helix-turn-helix transcriptional regulator [Solwaraspora sp. WMMD406]MDG4768546.1 helix-turn-helix transcriptional regulator [Solwaraspora sp. WMMD406]